MPLMEWKPSYSVGIASFDEDHQKLIRMLNELNHALQERKGKLVIGSILMRLMEYTDYHFSAEETAMRLREYEGYAHHRDEHRILAAKVRDYVSEFTSGNALISINVLCFLRDWLENHMIREDQAYSECLRGIEA